MKGMPLDFNPGEKWAYSNFGYLVLGRVIERVTGMPYADYVRTRVLAPAGANRTQQGKSRLSDARADEVKYYATGFGVNAPLVPSVFPGGGLVPLNYGGFYLEADDASGAWISSTVDLLRFLTHVDGREGPADILSAQTVAQMTGSGPDQCAGECRYAFGWWVRPVQGDATWWHEGDLPGSKAMLVRSYYDGISWVALFNTAAPNTLINELDDALWNALGSMTSFPTHDLFASFP